MKKALVLFLQLTIFTTLLTAQKTSENSELWRQIETCLTDRTPVTAQPLISKLRSNLVGEKITDQSAKLLIYRMMFSQMNEEKYLPDFIKEMESELNASWFPYTNLLHSMLAESYLNYFQQNRYSFFNHKRQEGSESQEIENLTKEQIFERIRQHIQLSLLQPEKLAQSPIIQWREVVEMGTKPSSYRDNLYDFLTWRGVDLYKQCNGLNSRPSNEFNPTEDLYFSSGDEFVKAAIISADSLNNNYLALKLIQELTKRYLTSNPTNIIEKLIDIDLQRIQHLYETYPITDTKYLKALKNLDSTTKGLQINSLIKYKIAQLLSQNETAESLETAVELCKEGYSNSPKSEGGINCKTLEKTIKSTGFNILMEDVYPSSYNINGLITYKNIDKIYVRIYDLKNSSPGKYDGLDSITKNAKIVRETTLEINNAKDYLTHSIEFNVDSIKTGDYVLIASAKKDFSSLENATNLVRFSVSNITIITDTENSKHQLLALNRVCGKPITNATFQITTFSEDYFRGKRVYFNGKVNENGEVSVGKALKEAKSYKYTIIKGDDKFADEEPYSYFHHEVQSVDHQEDYILTDRKIYRPNQPIFFKLVSFVSNNTIATAKVGDVQNVSLHDTNGKVISSQQVTTNKYGSASGVFNIPSSVLNGDWFITSNEGRATFLVEEYVRPKFEITFLPITNMYMAGDTAEVRGKATSYTMVQQQNCTVKYKISTSDCTIQPYKNDRSFPYKSQNYTLDLESTKTDKNGEFLIKFPIPISKDSVQHFTISVEVVSPMGETISAETVLNVSNTIATITADIKPIYELNSIDNKWTVSKINNNGISVNIPISYTIYSLNGDLPLVPEKLWRNDVANQLATYSDIPKQMPIFDNQANLSRLPLKELIFKGNLKSDENEIPDSAFKHLNAGIYRIVLTSIIGKGKPSTAKYEFAIINSNANNLETPAFLNLAISKENYKSGDTLRFTIGSTLKNTDIYYHILWNRRSAIDKKWTANNNKTLIEAPIPQDYIGNIIIETFTVHDNRLYHKSQSINVVSQSRDLKLKMVTFRDKIKPNELEAWKIEVKDFEQKSLNSELLVTMYDSSLDAFAPNSYNNFYNLFSMPYVSSTMQFELPRLIYGENFNTINNVGSYQQLTYSTLNWYNFSQYNFNNREAVYCMAMSDNVTKGVNSPSIKSRKILSLGSSNTPKFSPPVIKADGEIVEDGIMANSKEKPSLQAKIRENLQETAFFIPHLNTDSTGIATFSFTSPEALTTWKLMAFAHTNDGKSGSLEYKTTTQKDLMVTPNMPRFLYQNDRILFKTTISRITDKIDKGKITLTLTDEDGKNINNIIDGSEIQAFTFDINKTITIAWWINVGNTKNGIYVKTVAESENFSDGEQRFIPIIPLKTRVVESLPFSIINKGTTELTFKKFKDGCASTENRKFTINYTQNGSWEVIKALPFILEGTDENSDELFNRYYANALINNVLQRNNAISQTIQNWSNSLAGNEKALTGSLESKSETKSILLDQTPWLNDGKNETEERKRLALLLNQSKIGTDQSNSLSRLLANQMSNGAWPWFKGMDASINITQYITEGLILMAKDSIDTHLFEEQYWSMIVNGVNFCDKSIIDDYKSAISKNYTPNPTLTEIEYLATRQLVPNIEKSSYLADIESKYLDTLKINWTKYSPENQAIIAQWFYRTGDKNAAIKIMLSLFQCAIKNPELGSYYKRETNSDYFRNDIERHSNILKAFAEIGNYNDQVKLMQLYLIQQKRTNHWANTKATAKAISALMLDSENWLETSKKSDKIFVGSKELITDGKESGTGYFANSWTGSEVVPALANIKIEKLSDNPSWGSMSWDYYTSAEKIETNTQNPLTVYREYFKVDETDRGDKYEPITTKSELKIGEQILVRLTLKVDRPMEYIYLKDNRPTMAEPMEIFSGYTFNNGFGYYQNIKDASSNFYFNYMPKGTWKLEYKVRVSQIGTFSNGPCMVQCYYAPEYQNQTNGEKIKIEE